MFGRLLAVSLGALSILNSAVAEKAPATPADYPSLTIGDPAPPILSVAPAALRIR